MVLLFTKVALLICFCALAVGYGPFLGSQHAGRAAHRLQRHRGHGGANAVQRVHFASLPPTTMMTGTTVQATLDAVDLLTGAEPAQAAIVRARFGRLVLTLVCFAAGCAAAATLYAYVGFWCLVVAVLVGAAAAMTRIENPVP